MIAHKDAHFRSIAKAVSYRICAAIATSTIVFVFTRKFVLSVGVGLVEAFVKVISYYVRERVWSFIKIGKKEHPFSLLPFDSIDFRICLPLPGTSSYKAVLEQQQIERIGWSTYDFASPYPRPCQASLG